MNSKPLIDDGRKIPVVEAAAPSENAAEMPRYKSHKTVWALKIKRVEHRTWEVCLFFEDPSYAPIAKSSNWEAKFNPQDGGYYVVYADGYSSFSPAKAFEEGYTRL